MSRVVDEIEGVVREIRRACSERGEAVSELLAAFIVQAVLKANPRDFPPNQPLEADALERLLQLSVARLLERDSPSLETIKLQVGFDSSYVQLEEQLLARHNQRNSRLAEMQRTIVNVSPACRCSVGTAAPAGVTVRGPAAGRPPRQFGLRNADGAVPANFLVLDCVLRGQRHQEPQRRA